MLGGPSPEGSRWSGPQVAVWMSGVVGYPVSAQRVWEYLRRLGFTPRVPRRPSRGELEAAVKTVQQAHPDAAVELWTSDEHRLGLKPILRRARRGQRVLALVHHRYQWMYPLAFLAELETVQAQRCLTLQAQPERVWAATLFRRCPLAA